jgi:hypothetical protein
LPIKGIVWRTSLSKRCDWSSEKGDTMNSRQFWLIFVSIHVVGLSVAMLTVSFQFYSVMLGMLLLFPGIILTGPWVISATPLSALVAAILTITINVPFWIICLRSMSLLQPKPDLKQEGRRKENGRKPQHTIRDVRERSRAAAY